MQQPQRDPLDELWTLGQARNGLWHLRDNSLRSSDVARRSGRGDTATICGRSLTQFTTNLPWDAHLPTPDGFANKACPRCYDVLSTSDAYAAARDAIAKLRE